MPTILNETECQELLGASKERMDRFRRYQEHPMPYMRVGRSYRYDRDKVLEWAEAESHRDYRRELRPKYPWERRSRRPVAAARSAPDVSSGDK